MSKRVIQRHHPNKEKYPEWIEYVTKGEHFCLTILQRRKAISKGFLMSLQYILETKPVENLED